MPHTEYATRYLAMLSGGNAPQLVGPNGVSTVAEFFDTWEDVTPYIKAENFDLSDFYGPAVELNEYPDKNTGLPLGLYPSYLYYNKDLFDAILLAQDTSITHHTLLREFGLGARSSEPYVRDGGLDFRDIQMNDADAFQREYPELVEKLGIPTVEQLVQALRIKPS